MRDSFDSREGAQGERVLFVLVALAHLAPLVAFPRFVSQDGPAHVGNAFALANYFSPDLPGLREYFVLNLRPFPNWTAHVVLALLLKVAAPAVAERLLVAGLVVSLPLAVRYALRGISRPAGVLALAAFPFAYSFPTHMGFYSFGWGLSVAFLLIGFWLRRRDAMSGSAGLALAVIALALYFCHLVPLLLGAITLLAASGSSAAWALRLEPAARRRAWRSTGITCLALSPAVGLSAWFLATAREAGPAWREPLAGVVGKLLCLDALVSFDPIEVPLAALLATLILGHAVLGLRRRAADPPGLSWGLGLAAGVTLGVYLLAPSRAGGGSYIKERVALFFFLSLLPWIASRSFSRREHLRLAGAVTVLSLALVASRWNAYAASNLELNDYLSCAQELKANHTLFSMPFSTRVRGLATRDIGRVRPLLHASGYLVAERHLVDLKDYEAARDHFPLRYAPERSPFLYLAANEDAMKSEPPRVDLDGYRRRTSGRVDYLLAWDATAFDPGPGFERVEGCPAPSRASVYAAP